MASGTERSRAVENAGFGVVEDEIVDGEEADRAGE